MSFDLTEPTAVLDRTPAVLRSLLGSLPDTWTSANEGPDTFSPYDIVGHLIHGERTDWIPRARIILARGADRRFEPYDRFAQARESLGKDMSQLLDELERLRAGNLGVLRGWRLGADELALEGEHPELGPVTLQQLIATWVVHDLGHTAQAVRVMAGRYRDDVGGWRAYLSILGR